MPVVPKFRLVYFDLEGRAEVSRLMFHDANVNFEDHRITFDEWPQLKSSFPNEQLPVLEHNGKQLCQSDAINRFLAKTFGYYGVDEWDCARIDEIVATFADVVSELKAVILEENVEEKIAKYNKVLEAHVYPFYQMLETRLHAKANQNWLVGNDISLADFVLFNVTWNLHYNKGFPDVEKFPIEDFNLLSLIYQRIGSRPNLKDYLAGKKRKYLLH
uniref:glutathione transferase n=1 Tax=Steinernema glaseri TaxID=37863 RepID=A0A1I7Z8A1_9BILA